MEELQSYIIDRLISLYSMKDYSVSKLQCGLIQSNIKDLNTLRMNWKLRLHTINTEA